MKGTVPQNIQAPTMQPTLKMISIPCIDFVEDGLLQLLPLAAQVPSHKPRNDCGAENKRLDSIIKIKPSAHQNDEHGNKRKYGLQ